MEKIIVNPVIGKDTMIVSEAHSRMEDEGIILVFEKDKVIGSVILFTDKWILSTLTLQDEYSSLESILDIFTYYTFKYLA